MRYTRELIDQIRHAADIVQVVQEYVPLRKAGTTYKGLCPFHGERTPSFTVNRDKGFFHCFGCGQGGDVFKFVELQEGVGFQTRSSGSPHGAGSPCRRLRLRPKRTPRRRRERRFSRRTSWRGPSTCRSSPARLARPPATC